MKPEEEKKILIRFEFVITEPDYFKSFISGYVEVTEEELIKLLMPSDCGTMRSNQWITVNDEKKCIIVSDVFFPISFLKYAKIKRINEMESEKKKTVTANFPNIGNVEISQERADQIKRLQKMYNDRQETERLLFDFWCYIRGGLQETNVGEIEEEIRKFLSIYQKK